MNEAQTRKDLIDKQLLEAGAFKGELDLSGVGGGSEGEKRYDTTVIDQDSHH